MKKAEGGHVLGSDRLHRGRGGGVYSRMVKVRKVNWQTVSPSPSVHCNSPSRIILSNRLKGTLTEPPAACIPNGEPPGSSLREDIRPWQCHTFLQSLHFFMTPQQSIIDLKSNEIQCNVRNEDYKSTQNKSSCQLRLYIEEEEELQPNLFASTQIGIYSHKIHFRASVSAAQPTLIWINSK